MATLVRTCRITEPLGIVAASAGGIATGVPDSEHQIGDEQDMIAARGKDVLLPRIRYG